MRIVSFNMQYSLGADGRYDLPRSLQAVADADIICLQEVDRHWRRSGMADQPALIAAELADRYWVYGCQFDTDASAANGHGQIINRRRQFGQMTLSRWPIVASRTHIFPKLDSGARLNHVTGALETVIATPHGPLRIFNTHLSDVAAVERMLQIGHLMSLLRNTPDEGPIRNGTEGDGEHWESAAPPPPMPHQALLLGDFNAEPNSSEYAQLLRGTQISDTLSQLQRSSHHTFVDAWVASGNDPFDGVTYRMNPDQGAYWDQRLDYCFLPAPMAGCLKNAWIDAETDASDHQPIWVELHGIAA